MKTSVSPTREYRYELPKQGLQRKRFCTDIPCCLIFLLFVAAFVLLSIFAFQEGDPKQLLHPTDSRGQLCGTGNLINRTYVYYFDWTKCASMLNIPANFLKSRPFVCPTTQVCVEQCPTTTTHYKFGNYQQYRICTYDVDPKNTDNENLVSQGKCAPYVIASKSYFGRCIPIRLGTVTDTIIQALDTDGHNKQIYDSNNRPLNSTNLMLGLEYLKNSLNLKQLGMLLVEDLTVAWKHILVGLVLCAILSFIWIVLMRWLAKPLVWLGILLSFALMITFTAFAFYQFHQLLQKTDNRIITDIELNTNINYYLNLPITWLIIGIIAVIVVIISFLGLLAILKRLRLALAILREASKAVGFNIFSLFWPFIPFVLEIAIFAYWAAISVHLATSGKPIYRLAYNESMANSSNITLGDICDPKLWNNTKQGSTQCVFWEYGYDPRIDLDQIINGTGRYFGTFLIFVNEHQWIPQIFSIFMLFWLSSFIIGFSEMVLAGIYARYYWDRERIGVPCMSLCTSIIRALGFHLGTIAFGSLVISIVKLIRGFLEYFERKVKDKNGNVARCLFCCCRCCLFCLENFLKFLNRNAYIITAIYGTGFLTSARRAFQLIIYNPARLLVIDKVCDFLILLGKLCVTASIGVLAYFFFTHRIAQAEQFVPELRYYLVPLLLVILGSYIVATCFFSVYSMAVDTLFICAIQDKQLESDKEEHQSMMPKGLRKVFRES